MKIFLILVIVLVVLYFLNVILGAAIQFIKYRKFQHLVYGYIELCDEIKEILDQKIETPEEVKEMLYNVSDETKNNMSGIRSILILLGFDILEQQDTEELCSKEEFDEFIKCFTTVKQAALLNGEPILKEAVIEKLREQG